MSKHRVSQKPGNKKKVDKKEKVKKLIEFSSIIPMFFGQYWYKAHVWIFFLCGDIFRAQFLISSCLSIKKRKSVFVVELSHVKFFFDEGILTSVKIRVRRNQESSFFYRICTKNKKAFLLITNEMLQKCRNWYGQKKSESEEAWHENGFPESPPIFSLFCDKRIAYLSAEAENGGALEIIFLWKKRKSETQTQFKFEKKTKWTQKHV